MGNYTKIYFVSNRVFESSNPIEFIDFQIMKGDGNREWYEPYYFNKNINPIGKIKTMVPIGPDYKNSILDACIAFAPKYFESCPSLQKTKLRLKDETFLDFDLNSDKIPETWYELRKEAIPIFEKLKIFKINLEALTIDKMYLSLDYK